MARRLATTPGRRGTTLLELLVTMAMFAVILVTVTLIYRSGRDAYTKTDSQSDPFRMAALARFHIGNELRGARVVCPPPGDYSTLDFYQPDEFQGFPRFHPPDGAPVFLVKAAPTRLLLHSTAGRVELLRRGGGLAERKLADLGTNGLIRFHIADDTFDRKVCTVTIQARSDAPGDASRQGEYLLDVTLALTDVEAVQVPLDDTGNPEPPPTDPADAPADDA